MLGFVFKGVSVHFGKLVFYPGLDDNIDTTHLISVKYEDAGGCCTLP